MGRSTLSRLVSASILSLLPALACAGPEKLDAPLLVLAGSAQRARVIVQLTLPKGSTRRPYGWVSGDAQTLRALERSVAATGGRTYREFASLRGFASELPATALVALSNDPHVGRISLDWPVGGQMDRVNDVLGATLARPSYGLNGAGVGVAVIDTGIAAHPDLSQTNGRGSRIVAFVDFVNHGGNGAFVAPYDDCGHGTHVAGIIGGNGRSSTGAGYTRSFPGIAPNCNLIGVKALDRNNSGSTSTVISAVQWCIDHKARYNVRVINLSLGHRIGESATTDPLCAALEQAVQAGIVVCVSAGNEGGNGLSVNDAGLTSPADGPNVITVGAVEHPGNIDAGYPETRRPFSGRPALVDVLLKPEVLAVGNSIVSLRSPGSTLDIAYPWNQVPPSAYGGPRTELTAYSMLSGAGMATPTVSGTCALMLQKDPTLTPATVKGRIVQSAQRVGWSDISSRGFPYLDIPGALASTSAISSPSSPQRPRNGGGSVTALGNKNRAPVQPAPAGGDHKNLGWGEPTKR